MNKRYYIFYLILTAMLMSCKKPIFTKIANTSINYLVVNGNITPSDTTTITLSRLVSITDTTTKSSPELNATVVIEGSQNGSYALTSKNNGNYVAAPLNLSASQNYRIKITTSNGRQYASDFVPVKNSPPVDSLNFAVQPAGVNIYVNAHDPGNNTHYYRWDYAETYIVQSVYQSKYIEVDHDTTALRDSSNQVYRCWVTNGSSNLVLASSAKLSQDVIGSQLVTTVPTNSEKIRIRYSILVNQHALTPDAYNYFTLLEKNSTQVGGVFDAQPSELTGNVHCLTDKTEPVIGYITAGSVSTSRIFVDSSNVPGWTYTDPTAANCLIDTMRYVHYIGNGPHDHVNQVAEFIYTDELIALETVTGAHPPAIGFLAAMPACADCTLRGTNKKPSFWK